MRILVADDDETLRSELQELLSGEGHEVDTAADGREALGKIEAGGYDAALLDLQMPRLTGLDVLRGTRSLPEAPAIVMITGHGAVDVAVEAMKLGASDFVEKPFAVEALRKMLRLIEEERRARRSLAPARGPDAIRGLLRDAARRNALLAVVGPAGRPPEGALRTVRLGKERIPPDTFIPSQLYEINAIVDGHIATAREPVVYVEDPAPIETVHGPEDLRAWLRQVSSRCGARGGVLVLASADPALVAEVDQLEGIPGDPRLQSMLESLANPVRRAIVGFMFSSGPVAYSAILKRNFVDSSPKLAFHLQKLRTDGLLAKEKDGPYALTPEGRRAWEIVRALSAEGRRPGILFVPP